MRLLYVDDDRINTLLFVEACRFAGSVETETAASGAEALELVRRWTPDLLVIDLHLPDTTGYLLLPALRAALQSPSLPAFLCTADEPSRVAEPARQAGFEGCWTKPVDLRAILSELARRNGRSGPTPAPAPAE
jgi:CheY-like chemotaxis protein